MVERATWGDNLEDFDLKAQHQLILQNHEPLFLNLPPRRSSSAPKGTPLVYAGIPLIAKDQIFGVLDIFLEDTEYISGDHKSFLFALANQVASALSNALLFESEIAARKTSARLFNQAKGDRERLRVLTKKLVEAQEKERREIARELHDQTSQALVYLKIVLGLLRVEASDPQKVSERVAELNQITEDILNDLHRLAADLRPGTLDLFGLVPALQQYISNLSNKPGPKVNFTCLNVDQRFPPEVEVHLFRLVQEAVTNIFRHAHATNADILLSASQDKITLRVADDGIGFIFDEAIQKERLGLIGMRERVEMLGGTFQVDSTPDSGTQILIEVPYAH
jgi:signal transduction histidine kinase